MGSQSDKIPSVSKPVVTLNSVVIRFAGDSGDGMQLTGDRFTMDTASLGNDLITLPNYPAEIRAPQGTLLGVSSFQLHFADHHVRSPGDAPDVLVAMNPAALKANIKDMPRGSTIIVDKDEFIPRNLTKVGYETNPLEDGSLDSFHVHAVPLTSMTVGALSELSLTRKEAERSKNMFALGILTWMYHRPTEATEKFLTAKFAKKPEILQANLLAYRTGWNYGETTEDFANSFEVAPTKMPAGKYRNISGNAALALGLIAAGEKSGLQIFLGSYPITPASDILHELSKQKKFNIITFQAEDEIAAVGAALGASYGGALGITSTSGPGVALKSEMIGLGVMLELPLIIIDVQRGGPSTGLPTKTEQADLLQVMYGRNGESPAVVLACSTPSDSFEMAFEAVRIATTYRVPVFLLSDGYIANGSEPWRIPDEASLPKINVEFAKTQEDFLPYLRDPKTLARPWAIPGTAGIEHRIGGIEKADKTGAISYDPANHDFMVRTRQAKIDGIEIPDLIVDDPTGDAEVLILGWGSSYGPIATAVEVLRANGENIAHAQLRYINPFPKNLGEVLNKYQRVLLPEMNLGQLGMMLRAKYLKDIVGFNVVRGLPFSTNELVEAAMGVLHV
ncbi:MAG: 2-oxoacid:acceptor oxidoreductase subunit alpha [Actinomycetes bacterium]